MPRNLDYSKDEIVNQARADGSTLIDSNINRQERRKQEWNELRNKLLRSRSVAIDTETTGIAADDRFITIAAIELDCGKPTGQTLHLICNPERKSHKRAFKVHRLTDDYVAAQESVHTVAPEVKKFLDSFQVVVGHNVAFDLRIIDQTLSYCGLGLLQEKTTFCTMQVHRQIAPGSSAKLDHLAQIIRFPRSQVAHSAHEDAAIAASVAYSQATNQIVHFVPDSLIPFNAVGKEE